MNQRLDENFSFYENEFKKLDRLLRDRLNVRVELIAYVCSNLMDVFAGTSIQSIHYKILVSGPRKSFMRGCYGSTVNDCVREFISLYGGGDSVCWYKSYSKSCVFGLVTLPKFTSLDELKMKLELIRPSERKPRRRHAVH